MYNFALNVFGLVVVPRRTSESFIQQGVGLVVGVATDTIKA